MPVQTAAHAALYTKWMTYSGQVPLAALRALVEIGGMRLPQAMSIACRRSWALDDSEHLIGARRKEESINLREALLAELSDPDRFIGGRWDKLRALAAKVEVERLANLALAGAVTEARSVIAFAAGEALLADVPALVAALGTVRDGLPDTAEGRNLAGSANALLADLG